MPSRRNKRAGVEPALQRSLLVRKTAVRDAVRPVIAPGTTVIDRLQVLRRMHWHAGFERKHAVQLPAAKHLRREIPASGEEWQFVEPGRSRPVSLVVLRKALLQPPPVRIVVALRPAAGKRIEHRF